MICEATYIKSQRLYHSSIGFTGALVFLFHGLDFTLHVRNCFRELIFETMDVSSNELYSDSKPVTLLVRVQNDNHLLHS